MKLLKLTLVMLLLAAFAGCASTRLARPAPPTLDEIVEMSKAGTSADDIIKRLKESRALYELSASEIAKLHDRGVPGAVLDYMHEVHLREVRDEESSRSYYRYGWFFSPYFFYGFPHGRWVGGVRIGH